MIIKPAKVKTCSKCGMKEFVSGEEYGCDACKKPIVFDQEERAYLDVTVFQQGDNVTHYQLCSWKCVFELLKTVSSNYFVSLPYLLFDAKNERLNANGFFKAIKNLRRK
jgi:hypothetical protein